jgi:hypothetical protein
MIVKRIALCVFTVLAFSAILISGAEYRRHWSQNFYCCNARNHQTAQVTYYDSGKFGWFDWGEHLPYTLQYVGVGLFACGFIWLPVWLKQKQ